MKNRLLEEGPNRLSVDEPPDQRRMSLAHASLAKITYRGSDQESWLLYIKPTLTGDEPTDILQYHGQHNNFPHEPTIDQFFDEAQWESYRRLGQHIGDELFEPNEGAPSDSDWTPIGVIQPPDDKEKTTGKSVDKKTSGTRRKKKSAMRTMTKAKAKAKKRSKRRR